MQCTFYINRSNTYYNIGTIVLQYPLRIINSKFTGWAAGSYRLEFSNCTRIHLLNDATADRSGRA